MAETREVFTIVENDSTAAGEKLPARQDGVTAATGNNIGALVFKDNSGNDVKVQLAASGAVPVAVEPSGTAESASAVVTIAALSTEQDVAVIPLNVNEVIQCSYAMGSMSQPCVWVLYHDDNSTLNELARFFTGPGDFTHSTGLPNIGFTAGSTGTQRLVLRATQLRGALTDANGTISLMNKGA